MNWYIDPITKHYADFQGVASRKEYWMFFLFNFIASILVGFVAGFIHLPAIGSLYSLAVLLPSIGIAVRRMHDIGKSGWWVLAPFYNIWLLCQPSSKPYGKLAATFA
ncbi:MAG TPA: DUF805 domain-containing protein [Caulobacteraceae bacterium]